MPNSYWDSSYKPLFPDSRGPGPHYDVWPLGLGSIPEVPPPPQAFLVPADTSTTNARVAIGLGLGALGLLAAFTAKKKMS